MLAWNKYLERNPESISSFYLFKYFFGGTTQHVHNYSVSRSVLSNSLWPHGLDHQAPLSMGFSRQEYWSEQLFPSQGESCQPGSKPDLHVAGRLFTIWATREALPLSMWDLVSPTRNQTHIPCIGSMNSYPACSADTHMPLRLVPVSRHLHIISQ